MKRLLPITAALVLITSSAATTAAATPAIGPSHGGTPAHPQIVIRGFGYTGNLVVRPGVTVHVTNQDAVRHTLTHKAKGHFNTGPIPANGGKRTFRAPTKVGKYPFGCQFHPEMAGVLTVRRAPHSG